jgi:hypothetical protein
MSTKEKDVYGHKRPWYQPSGASKASSQCVIAYTT